MVKQPSTVLRQHGPMRALAVILLVSGLAGCALSAPDARPRADLGAGSRGALTVAVRDAAGTPVDGWVVLDPSGRDAALDDGVATFAALRPGTYTVEATAPGGAATPVEVTIALDPAEVELVWVPVAAGLRGRVRDQAGAPIQGATVAWDGAVVATTDADGRWEAGGLQAGGGALRVEPPAGQALLPWTGSVQVDDGRVVVVDAALAFRNPDGAAFLGSATCAECHAKQADAWAPSGHGAARWTTARLNVEAPADLLAAWSDRTWDLGGFDVTLTRGASWSATLSDGASTVGPLPLVEAYGGHGAGFAFAALRDGAVVTLPFGWAAATTTAPGALVAAWTDGWFDGGALAAAAGPEASFALRCAGCHATGYRLEEDGGFALVAAPDAAVVEPVVGCEACHGPAGGHVDAVTGARSPHVVQPGALAPEAALALCSRCHERVAPDAHPLSSPPGPPLDDHAEPLLPWVPATDAGEADGPRFADAGAAAHRDQVADFRQSPHQGAWRGDCTDCHDAHGSAHAASLRHPPGDNSLCTGCHRAAFPDQAAEAAHARHRTFAPQTGGPGACVDCHLPGLGRALRPDPVTGAGESHAHTLRPVHPDAVLAAFGGAASLPLDAVPVNGCLACHLRAEAEAQARGGSCGCPQGDPTLRSTWEAQQAAWTAWEAP